MPIPLNMEYGLTRNEGQNRERTGPKPTLQKPQSLLSPNC